MTDAELLVLAKLVAAWDAFIALPIEHSDDQLAFRLAIHSAQDILLSRPMRRELNRVPSGLVE
jgi:hypothetical protein